jgi:hypothetical protein
VRNGVVEDAARDIEARHSVVVQVEDSRTVAANHGRHAGQNKEEKEISERKAPLRA